MEELSPIVGSRAACRALGIAPATLYRHRRPPAQRAPRPRVTPARALSLPERETMLAELHSERFWDSSPAVVWATLLDEGRYFCSERTMYRLLAAEGETRTASLRTRAIRLVSSHSRCVSSAAPNG